MIHDQTKKYEWDAMEFEHTEKSNDWYWALGIAVVAGIVISIISKNYLFAVLLAVGGVLIGKHAGDKPHPIHVEISERGIRLNDELYTYETMQSFWMYVDHKNQNRLIITTGRAVMPKRVITLPETIQANAIRNYLLEFLEEKETKPSVIDLIADAVGL